MKYLVVKGWLGFGDRLESLKMAVWFAIQKNLKIYVDWTDSTWTHGSETFYSYFKLVNMPVIESLDDIPADATVYPKYWKDNLKSPLTQEIIDKEDLNLGFLKIDTLFDADVVVYSSIGNRMIYNDPAFFANVFRVINAGILSELVNRKRRVNMSTTVGIHIRGTDRFNNPIKKQQSIQYMAVNALMNGRFSGKSMIIVSDDRDSIDLWIRFYAVSIVFSKLSLDTKASVGIHTATKDQLVFSKDHMNTEMLTDFFTFASCERVLSTCKDSRFAQEARRLHSHINLIIGNG